MAQFGGHAKKEPFYNICLTGPQGVGKTSVAKAMAQELKDAGIIPANAPIIFQTTESLTAGYSGQTTVALRQKFEAAKDGVLILDEADSWLTLYSYGANALRAMNGFIGASPNQPIVIMTCYSSNLDSLLTADPGLDGRFNTYQMSSYNNEQLLGIFRRKLDDNNLLCENSAIFDEVDHLIKIIRAVKGAHFSNAREIDTLLGAIVKEKNARLEEIGFFDRMDQEEGNFSEDSLRSYRLIKLEDMPHFDRELRNFIPKHPEEKVEAAVPAIGHVISFQPR